MRITANELVVGEFILGKNAAGQFQALSGLALTKAVRGNPHDGLDKAYVQWAYESESYFFFGYCRLQFSADNDSFRVGIYGTVGSGDTNWGQK